MAGIACRPRPAPRIIGERPWLPGTTRPGPTHCVFPAKIRQGSPRTVRTSSRQSGLVRALRDWGRGEGEGLFWKRGWPALLDWRATRCRARPHPIGRGDIS